MTTYFPPNLIPQIANPEAPWFVSDPLFQRASQQPANPYRKCEVLQTDPEWDFVHRYFQASQPKGKAIKAIYYIHNPVLTQAFTTMIRTASLESQQSAYKPSWEKDPKRKDVIERWVKISSVYPKVKVPFEDGRKEECSGAYLLPLWHGTSAAKSDSIAKTGFAWFGQSAGALVTDDGYFGKGIYLTDSAKYANMYNSTLLLSWACMRTPYPVIGDSKFPNQSDDMKALKGKVKFSNANAHFVPVASTKPQIDSNLEYYPYPPTGKPDWDEFVFFDKAQVLPCFEVELIDESQASSLPGTISKTINEFKALLKTLATNAEVQKNSQLQSVLQLKLKDLEKYYEPSEKIPSIEKEFFSTAENLFDSAKKVQDIMAKKLLEIGKKAAATWALKKKDQVIGVKGLHPHNIPRQTLLKTIEEAIFTKGVTSYVLFGPGGVGKSELAIAFANAQKDKFSLIWSIACGTEEERMLDYRKLAEHLKLAIEEKESDGKIIEKVHFKLEQNQGKPWLLIYDNLNSSCPMPARGGVCLITAYSKGSYKGLEVGPLTEIEGVQLLEKVAEKKSPLFSKLLEATGCYTLLLDQAATYIARTGVDIEEYLGRLQKGLPLQLDPSDRYKKTLEVALRLTLDHLKPLTFKWLNVCVLFNATKIPFAYLDHWLLKDYPDEQERFKISQEVKADIAGHALIRLDNDNKAFGFHLDLQKELLKFLNVDYSQTVEFLVSIENLWDFDNTKDWKKTMEEASVWASHTLEILKQKEWEQVSSASRGNLLTSLGTWRYEEASYQLAELYHQQALKCRQKDYGEKHPAVADSLSNIGNCYFYQGKYDEAIKNNLKALEVYTAVFGEKHPDVATSLSNIGRCYVSQGKYDEAIKNHLKALEVYTAVFGEKHSDVATSLDNIGNCYFYQGKYDEAMKNHLKALEIRRDVFRDRHPDVADSLSNIGRCYVSQGKYDEAIKNYLKALEIYIAVYGEKQPDMAVPLNNIGYCYFSQGKYDEAMENYLKALEIQRDVFGDRHPDVATSLGNIGNCYDSQGKYDEAMKYLLQALEIRRDVYGDKHPDVALSLNCIGNCYNSQRKYDEALKNFQDAYNAARSALGELHKNTQNYKTNLSLVQSKLNSYVY